ncbi:MAG: FHA domain-containing protein, partial [Bdellovibrionales bacterium]|nr:FHA domain-containing protein [Bdellovibrionales bacterium]
MEEKQHFKLTISGKGKDASFDVDKDIFVLGRGKECDVVVEDDLISRKHLKIYIQDGIVSLEELGSTNGTLFNNIKMERGQKVTYHSKSKILLGGPQGLTLGFEKVAEKSNIVKINAPQINNQTHEEKTIVASMPMLKVANGSSIPVAKAPEARQKSSSIVTVNMPSQNPVQKAIKSVAQSISKTVSKSVSKGSPTPSVKNPSKSIKLVQTTEELSVKKSFDDEVKQLVSLESDKLRRQSVKDAEYIKKRALEQEANIIREAENEARDIIEAAKKEAIKNRQEAEESIASLKERVRKTQNDSEHIIKTLKSSVSELEDKVATLRQVESGHTHRIRQYDDDFASIRERVKNENLLLEELKIQSSTVKKSADLKLEEVILQERRSRATIETEIAEARTQTAKIFAEAEKAATQKSLLEPEIQQLKTEKSKIEKDINEAQISYKRAEYDLEKIHKDQNVLNQDINEAKAKLEELVSKAKIQQDQILAAEAHFIDRERSIQLKMENADLAAQQVIENAHGKARDIVQEAQDKSQKYADLNAKTLRDLENHKLKLQDDIEAERKVKILSAQNEIQRLKEAAQGELDKFETKKTNLANELKWMETNTAATCEKLVN